MIERLLLSIRNFMRGLRGKPKITNFYLTDEAIKGPDIIDYWEGINNKSREAILIVIQDDEESENGYKANCFIKMSDKDTVVIPVLMSFVDHLDAKD